ncbi:nitrilase-related carbon-nitrogen hydrolase [Paraburkholderia sp. SARCC-3016]|uniref:nitrilase-related carbon-nitrogen hydrolase n=1 Tax=Paraburkholderia sp. SARCC-3016 TaxID=3058611 RepID=UPI002809FB2D|nr:nitrilase-related carbon-nitrogen hydrolase [Paraburkholderia sp. SARCC-3016]MDQ7977936.1 nitrilase-related carbon-nitrogen hydrolase [Paraburkholderia sp. SARCC-3016]
MTSPSSSTLRIAAISLVSRRGEARDNVSRIVALLEEAARAGIALAVFPEACISGVRAGRVSDAAADVATSRLEELRAVAEPLDGPSISVVAQAVERTGVAAGVGWIERGDGRRLFNSYVVCMPDGTRHCHRKLHVHGGRLGSGNRFTVFDTQWGVRVGILIGADNELVENARVTALMGATLLLAPYRCECTGPRGTVEALRRALPGRALDNGTFIAMAAGRDDASGDEADDEARGHCAAMIVDPHGDVLADSIDCHGIASANLDLALANARVVQLWRAARRPSLYRPLTATGSHNDDFEPLPETGQATARGAVPISFAVVRRGTKPSSSGGAR